MNIDYAALLPEIVLSLFGILIMLCVPFVRAEQQSRLGYLGILGVLFAFASVASQWGQTGLAFWDMVFQDPFSQFAKMLFLFVAASITLASMNYLEREELRHGEFFSLLLFATTGMCLMASSADLILTFLGLEILSIPTYILAGFKQRETKSAESGLKYFILGAFSTAFLLYGIAFLYGSTGSTKYLKIASAVAAQGFSPMLGLGLAFIVVGFGFKSAITPFHVWTPDVYEGAPVPVTNHLAVGSKAAALIAFLRILYQMLPGLSPHWEVVLAASAILTMAIGNVAALIQSNIKRMLGYSSIAHAGYLLVGLTAHNALGRQGILFYLLAYALMNLGAFTVVQVFARRNEQYVSIEDYAGIGYRYPFLSAALSLFLISLAGIPATAGFMGKFFLFAAAVESRNYALVVIALIASAIGIYYYLRIIVLMYMRDPLPESPPINVPILAGIVIVIMIAGTLYLGIYPKTILNLASEAVFF